MTIRNMVLVGAALIGIVLLSHASAQQGTATVSGRIYAAVGPGFGSVDLLYWSADTPTPIYVASGFDTLTRSDDEGNFTISGLEDGDYIVLFTPQSATLDISATVPIEMVEVMESEGIVTQPGFRVSIVDGQSVSGIEIRLTIATPSLPNGQHETTPVVPDEFPITGQRDASKGIDRWLPAMLVMLGLGLGAGAVSLLRRKPGR